MLQNNTRGEEELMKVFETIVHGNEQDLMQENANVDYCSNGRNGNVRI